jgi:hypothetical protein
VKSLSDRQIRIIFVKSLSDSQIGTRFWNKLWSTKNTGTHIASAYYRVLIVIYINPNTTVQLATN